MNELINKAIADLDELDQRLQRNIGKMSDEQLAWSPSASSRSALHLVAHCANSLGFIGHMFTTAPYPTPTTAEADRQFLELEAAVTTRDQALELWAGKLSEFKEMLRNLTEEQLNQIIKLPFDMGSIKLSQVVHVGGLHTREHLAQLEYLQTIYGDREW